MIATQQLRPMSIGDLFDAAFRLYRRHFFTFIGIVALLQVPMAIIQFVLQYIIGQDATMDVLRFSQRSNPFLGANEPLSTFPIRSLLIFYVILIGTALFQLVLVQTLLTGALANAISRSYLGRAVSILSAYSFGWRSYLSLIGSMLILVVTGTVLLSLFFACLVGGAIAVASRLEGPNAVATAGILGAATVFGALFLMIPVLLFLYLRFILSTQAIVLEQRGPLAGLGRSWRLISGTFWRTFLIFILVLVLSLLLSVVPTYLVTFLLGLIGEDATTTALFIRNQAIATFISQIGLIIAYPLLFSVYTLLYYDLRIRKEGYDLEVLAQQAAQT